LSTAASRRWICPESSSAEMAQRARAAWIERSAFACIAISESFPIEESKPRSIELFSTATKLRVRGPLHLPSGGSPPPLARGRMSKAAFPIVAFGFSLRFSFSFFLPSFRYWKQKEAERRKTLFTNHRTLRSAARALLGRARLPAFHRGSRQGFFRSHGSASGQATWDAAAALDP
jgi:hypothetical protein